MCAKPPVRIRHVWSGLIYDGDCIYICDRAQYFLDLVSYDISFCGIHGEKLESKGGRGGGAPFMKRSWALRTQLAWNSLVNINDIFEHPSTPPPSFQQ